MRPRSGCAGEGTFQVGANAEFLQGDYRQLVHELDEAEYQDIRLMVMEIRNAYVRRGGEKRRGGEGGGRQKCLSLAFQFLTKQTWGGG